MERKANITLETIIQRNPGMVTSKLDDEIVMMSIENGEYYGLDEIGSRIWELIEAPVSMNKLIETLMDEFEVEHSECENDTIEFVDELLTKHLLILA